MSHLSRDRAAALRAIAIFTVTLAVLAASLIGVLPMALAAQSNGVGFFSTRTVPRQPNFNDSQAVEVGTRFTTSASGVITDLLYYRGKGNIGTHRGTLWTADGQVLTRVNFVRESTTGWQRAHLDHPVPVRAGRGYVVSYRALHGHYAAQGGQFARGGLRNGALTATAGVYSYDLSRRQGFPDQVWNATGYFVDIRFAPNRPRPSTPTSPAPSPHPSSPQPSSPTAVSPSPSDPAPSSPAPTDPVPTAPTGPSGGQRTNCSSKPSDCGYPDASTTGVPANVHLTRRSGTVVADRPGQVIDALDVTGEIVVTAPDVTIRNTRVTGGRGAGNADWVVLVRPGADRLKIEDVEFTTPPGSAQDLACVLNIGDSEPTVLRADLHGCSIGVSSGGGLVADSWIHDLAQISGLSHNNGVASMGGGGLTVRHNTILNQLGQTSAVALYQDFGTQSNDLITDNLLGGGGYCVYGGDGRFGATSSIRIERNRFSRGIFHDCGQYGPLAHFTSAAGNAFEGNVWDPDLSAVE